ncbi:MAG: TspO/MBR family protein [Candidatus Komeilibacteria bacterium]
MKQKNYQYLILILSIAAAEFAGVIGSFFTFPSIPSWYSLLIKPSFSPPDWLFGPVWIILYALMGTAAWLIWKQQKKSGVCEANAFYGFQLALNVLWSILFFDAHFIGLALLEIVVLWLMILTTTIFFFRLSRTAAYLMLPYLAWVTFAVVLNYSLWQLN